MRHNMSPRTRASQIDKENVRHPHSSSSSNSNKTPKRKLPLQMKTPPGSSKLLRQHFAHLSVTSTPDDIPPRSGSGSTRRRRLLESGPVRILSPATDELYDETISDSSFFSLSSNCGHDWEAQEPRRDCMDPVASTLLLWQEEPLQSWSSDLEDVYGRESTKLARPKPFRPTVNTRTGESRAPLVWW